MHTRHRIALTALVLLAGGSVGAAPPHLCWLQSVQFDSSARAEIRFNGHARGHGRLSEQTSGALDQGALLPEFFFDRNGQIVRFEKAKMEEALQADRATAFRLADAARVFAQSLVLPPGVKAQIYDSHESCSIQWGQKDGRPGVEIRAGSSYLSPTVPPTAAEEFIPVETQAR